MANQSPPWGLQWRSSTSFIITTVAVGLFTDLFLYGLVVPVLPFMLVDRLSIAEAQVQSYVSGLLAVYAAAAVLSSVPAGWIADRTKSRQEPFLTGLAVLLVGTTMFAFGQSMAALVVARILQGVSAAVVWTAGLAMVMDTVGPGKLGEVIGSIFSIVSAGELVAPVLGGILYDTAGIIAVFGVAAGVLGIDFIMRLLVIEKKTATKYNTSCADECSNRTGAQRAEPQATEQSEEDALLPLKDDEAYKVRGDSGRLVRAVPILYCLRNPRLLMALLLSFVQSSLIAIFDATLPTEAQSLFQFTSLKAGLLFIALDVPYLSLAQVAGWAVDRYGTKVPAVVGFTFLVPCLILLRLPSEGLVSGSNNIILYCVVLALNGVGLAIIGSPSFVEASDVIQRYDDANPGFFGQNGPYAQLYGFNSVFFFAGLTVGPILSGVLRDSIGYGNMAAVFAAVSGITAILSFLIVGGKPKIWSGRA
ncbi:Putative MFS-type transporter C18.02 [Tolypocladium paradoxum]|uniref:MFS-type transporter C18.02 n=1 Tax=Tolypocladium paradoxum TaxID=94208 RepID=A0A2S4KQC5_9HYPO|nr:Putative MFS-type transporter C18.02 [Tolypocladium paradoxum]